MSPNGSTNLTVDIPAGSAVGNYTVLVDAISGSTVRTESISVSVSGTPSLASLLGPSNGATGEILNPALSWSAVASASAYTVEIATDANFSNIVESGSTGTNSYGVVNGLNPTTVYYWRVFTVNSCGNSAASSVFSFETNLPNYCNTNGSNSSEEWIAEVTLNTINNITGNDGGYACLLYTSPSPRDATLSRMPSSA